MKVIEKAHGITFTFECPDGKEPDKGTVLSELQRQKSSWFVEAQRLDDVSSLFRGTGFSARLEITAASRFTTTQLESLFMDWSNSIAGKL